ncbi:hypothetical protein INT48_007624 [Thamnidium elegans]|uniref:Uncharacterized protein n=1 Tax=Thamnidium elegans TaxID=101142 RepID=A0A8H7SMB7_9FUNG|nr:hypothetical protein INT48_007624 [Thamnidium elegans]
MTTIKERMGPEVLRWIAKHAGDRAKRSAKISQNEYFFLEDIKKLKQGGSNSNNRFQLYKNRDVLKVARTEMYTKLNKVKRKLGQTRQALYYKQMAIKFKDKLESESASDSPPAKQEIDFQSNGVVFANRRSLQNPENFIYSA